MANKGWDSQLGGSAVASNARQSGRMSGTDGAEGFVRGSREAAYGNMNDPLDLPSDQAETPGNNTTC